MLFTESLLSFKHQFRSLNYYSMPTSILFIVRKRFNLLLLNFFSIYFLMFTIL